MLARARADYSAKEVREVKIFLLKKLWLHKTPLGDCFFKKNIVHESSFECLYLYFYKIKNEIQTQIVNKFIIHPLFF